MFEKVVGATVTQWNEYLFAGGEMVGEHFSRSDATEFLRYFVKDHLGSIAVLTDESGAVTERLSFDAWGKRRYADGTDDPTGSITSETTRGFTGHEMIDDVDLVNMNGRIYDPNIGRFMSADPFIHEVTNSQDLNRYSYVHNNPLSYTDQNGYGFFKKLGRFFKKIWKPLLAIAVAVVLQQYELIPTILPGSSSTAVFLNGAIQQGITGGISNVILTGRPKAFLAGFGQGAATFGVGHGLFGKVIKGSTAFGKPAYFGKAVAHGVVGGAFTEIRGGSFKSGFLAAGFSSAAGAHDFGNRWANSAYHAVVGGTGSVLGGGKFADGAVTGAFTYLFNDALEGYCKKNTCASAGEERQDWLGGGRAKMQSRSIVYADEGYVEFEVQLGPLGKNMGRGQIIPGVGRAIPKSTHPGAQVTVSRLGGDVIYDETILASPGEVVTRAIEVDPTYSYMIEISPVGSAPWTYDVYGNTSYRNLDDGS